MSWYSLQKQSAYRQLQLPFGKPKKVPAVDIDNVYVVRTGFETHIVVNGEKRVYMGLSPYCVEKFEKQLAWRKKYSHDRQHNSANNWIERFLRQIELWRKNELG